MYHTIAVYFQNWYISPSAMFNSITCIKKLKNLPNPDSLKIEMN